MSIVAVQTARNTREEPTGNSEANRTGSVCLTGVVLEALAHLLSVRRQHKPVHDEVLEGRLVEQSRSEHRQGVEPASRLETHKKTRGTVKATETCCLLIQNHSDLLVQYEYIPP